MFNTWSAVSSPLKLTTIKSLMSLLLQLNRHREFLGRMQAEGAQISLLIELSNVENSVLTLGTGISRKLADLNIEVEFQFVGE